jgi:predicted mannosyl-3-phosphoglycerate phosphatase (HAD superfamily)
MNIKKIHIYLDFDGTVVEHSYPEIGIEVPNSIRVIKKLIDSGHFLILNTYRANISKQDLDKAIEYLSDKLGEKINVSLLKINPTYWNIDKSIEKRHLFIDDMCLGIPLIPAKKSRHKMVNWDEVEKQLIEKNLLNK